MTRTGKIAILTAVVMSFGAALAGAHAADGADPRDCRAAMMEGGHGMMGHRHGMMMEMMGGPNDASVDKQLSADDVRAIITGHLIEHGNRRLKVGNVVEQDKDKVVADVVTVDNSLVHKVEVDRHNGRMHPVMQ